MVHGPPDLCVISADGTGLTSLTNTPEEETSPLWSPDGEKIAFVGEGGAIYVMDADGSNKTPVFDAAGVQVSEPVWQP